MMSKQLKKWNKKRGASLTGYGLVVGLIAILAISAVGNVGDSVRDLFGIVDTELTDVATGSSGASGGSSSSGGSSGGGGPSILTITATGGPFEDGQTITITLDADEDLQQSGTPTLSLDVGGVTQAAGFSGLSAGNALFTYIVGPTDDDQDGVEVTSVNAAAGELTNGSLDLDTGSFTFPHNLGVLVDSCPNVGDVCADGSLYAGIGPDAGGTSKLYITRCDAGQSYNSGSGFCECDAGEVEVTETTETSPNRIISPAASGLTCGSTYNQGTLNAATVTRSFLTWGDGSDDAGFPATSVLDFNTGQANSASLAAESGAASPFVAAQYCENLVRHGRDDWYLPARAEFDVVVTAQGLGGTLGNSFSTSGNQTEGRYWTSTQESGSSNGYNYKFSNSSWNWNPPTLVFHVRCARR